MKISAELLGALSKWTSTEPTRPHLHFVVVRDGCALACDGHRLAIVPVDASPSVRLALHRADIEVMVAAVKAAYGWRMLELTLERERIRVDVGILTFSARRGEYKDFPGKEVTEGLIPKQRGGVPLVAVNPKYLGAILDIEDALARQGELGKEPSIKLAGWGSELDGVLFLGHTGAKYLVMPVRQ